MGRHLPVISGPPPSPHRAGEGAAAGRQFGEVNVEMWRAGEPAWRACGGLGGAGGLGTTPISTHGAPVHGVGLGHLGALLASHQLRDVS